MATTTTTTGTTKTAGNATASVGTASTTAPSKPNAPTTEQVTEKAQDLLQKLSVQIAQAEEKLRAVASEKSQQASAAADEAVVKKDELAESLTEYVKEKPLHAFGMAALGGAILGMMLRR